MKKIIYIVTLTLLCSVTARSQSGGFYSFNDLYDFNTKEVYDILQDKQGMIWIASADGLFRFDGTNFINYYHTDYDKEATNLAEDPDGRIWYCNFAGQIFYIEQDSCHLFVDYSKDLTSLLVYSIGRFPQIDILTSKVIRTKNFHTGNVTTTTKNENIFRLSKNVSVTYNANLHVFKNELYCAFSYRRKGRIATSASVAKLSGNKFTGSEKGFSNIVRGNMKFLSFKNDLYLIDFSTTKRDVYKIINDTPQKLFSFTTTSGLFPRNMQFLDSGELMVAEANEVAVYNLLTKKKSGIPFLNDMSISRFMRDREGNQWYTSTTDGIIIRTKDFFETTKISDANILLSAFHPNGTVYTLNKKGDFVSASPSKNIIVKKKLLSNRPYSMTFNPICKKILFTGAELMLATDDTGKPVKKSFKSNTMGFKKCVFINEEYTIASAGSSALLYRNNLDQSTPKLVSKSVMEFYDAVDMRQSTHLNLRVNRCMGVALDKRTKDVYIDFVDGLCVFGNYTSAEIKNGNHTIICDELLADNSHGLWSVDNQKNLLRIIDRKVIRTEKLTSSVKYMAQWKNYLFLANDNQILKYDTLTKKQIVINYVDGLPRERIMNITVAGDKLRVLTEKHVTDIPCTYNYTNTVAPKVFINQVKVYDDTLVIQNSYKLSSAQRSIEIFFSALSIRSQKQFNYQYRMLGASDDWVTNTSAVPFARFPKLEAGDYVFELRACNEDGVCSKVKKIKFVISPVFYKTWWFVLLSLLAFGMLAFFVTRYWFKNREREQKLEQEKDVLEKEVFKSKIAAIRSQMNPHFMFNALNTIQEFIMTNQKDIASEYLADFADLMRLYLNQSKEDKITLEDEIATLQLYLKLEKLRFEEDFDFEIIVEESLRKHDIEIPVMLLQPFVENAIKHGLLHKKGEKRLNISFANYDGNLLVTIEDNGIGRKKSREINSSRKGHDSFATSAIEERIKMYNQSRSTEIIKVEIEDLEIDSGTIIKLEIPIEI